MRQDQQRVKLIELSTKRDLYQRMTKGETPRIPILRLVTQGMEPILRSKRVDDESQDDNKTPEQVDAPEQAVPTAGNKQGVI